MSKGRWRRECDKIISSTPLDVGSHSDPTIPCSTREEGKWFIRWPKCLETLVVDHEGPGRPATARRMAHLIDRGQISLHQMNESTVKTSACG
jgi:hypothetical protein